MERPGLFNLGDAAVSAVVTNSVITSGSDAQAALQAYIDRLQGMTALTLFANFTWGAGGTTCAVIVETCLDDVNWIPIARFDFTTASASKVANLSGLLSKAIAAVAALSSEGVNDGVLGSRLRAKVTTTGVYTGNTAISVRAQAR